MERLQKIIAARGLCSRRQAEKWIEEGRVRVNGNTAHLGDTADITEDVIEVDGKRLPKAGKQVYLMLNKPRGYVTTLSDEKGRKNAAELVAEGEVLGYRHILGGDGTAVPLVAARGFSYSLAPGETPEIVLSPSYFSFAPVRMGGEEGCAYVVLDGRVVGEIPLVWGSSLETEQKKERTWLTRLFGGT